MADKDNDLNGKPSRKAADELARARARQAEAEARKFEAEARRHEAEAVRAEIERDKAEEIERKRLADNEHHKIYVFEGQVSDSTVNACVKQLDIWERVYPGCDVTIRFYSPGGDVIAGMYLFDRILQFRAAGHKVTTEAYGYAASMAGILLQAGDHRVIGREAYILIHEISFGVRGKVGEVEDEMEFVKKIADRVLDIFAEGAARAAANGTAKHALTKAQFKRRWTRKDWWLSSSEAIEFGVVDEVK